ncbi:class I SAM-dependent methyltransferase [Celeribacter arenosi]|uniref:SAM-dependent methyltransferase n=1 Tax=Celeribacter arenosi TaxID=792649 RepID=A0ABP7K320_9RHOB
MTPLSEILARRIAQTGPINLAEYMAECLLHPEHGYYTTRDPLGVDGDFTTAPEVSQMFGELIGLSLAQSWIDQGSPERIVLAEIGPGRGTLMADALRATAGVAGFHDALSLYLVEASPTLQARQAEALASYRPTWLERAEGLPDDRPLYLVANEFFDALPIRQFTRDGSGWRETQVGLDDGKLVLGLSTPTPMAALTHRLGDTETGDIVEICPAAGPVMAAIARRIVAHGGAGIVIDYGDWRSLGDTFQALAKHEPVDPLAHPGQVDLTAHVDFEALATEAFTEGAAAHMITQQMMLARLGIEQRAERLSKGKADDVVAAVGAAFDRLTSPTEMGTLFKALGIGPDDKHLPAGFSKA